jgi:hypothetical protein
LNAVAQAELGEHAGDVGLDRRAGDHEPVGDLGVGEAARDQLEDLELARGELLQLGRGVLPSTGGR